MFEKLKRNSAVKRLVEEQLFEQVVEELARGYRRDGLWAKAISNSGGLEDTAKALYIQYRVQSIKDEAELNQAVAEGEQRKLIENREKQLATIEESLESMGCKIKYKKGQWHIVDYFKVKASVESLEDLITMENFLRRLYAASTTLMRAGYRVALESDGWSVKRFFEGTKQANSIEEMEDLAEKVSLNGRRGFKDW